ncbi:hypothetical protein PHYBOEH_002831 [Phytophthora boehmeriae]|uniref:Uncharacterized protein n=1 Tax=Phytophthora boehmeriae TaxID=109152 RepID=A0A8T1V309_9STRA|nr:hypothetical protein PHYBOEH_002831 [Phytophthora boehmeriae]
MLIEKHVDNIGGNADFREKLTRFMVDRQSFEEFVEFFRRVKSAVYYDTLVNISTFHTGARFDSLNEILIQEPKDDIGVAGSSASANGICSKVELTIDGNQVLCNEVIQVLRTEKKLTNAAYALEREKAVNDNSDVFLLITRRPVTKNFLLPDRCGVVSQSEFEHYFGPFASRAYRSFRGPPGKQTKTTK